MTKPKQIDLTDRTALTVTELREATKTYNRILGVAVDNQEQKKEYANGKYKDVRKLREELAIIAAQVTLIIEAIDSI